MCLLQGILIQGMYAQNATLISTTGEVWSDIKRSVMASMIFNANHAERNFIAVTDSISIYVLNDVCCQIWLSFPPLNFLTSIQTSEEV